MLRNLLVLSFACLLLRAAAAPAQTPPGAGVGASASAPAASAADAALPPELQAELDRLMPETRWVPSATARLSAGWRDNVLLSSFAPIQRSFGRVEMEGMLWRPARNDWEFLTFVSGDVLRYVSPPVETSGEQQWSASADARWWPVAPLRLSLRTTGYLSDSVIDLSETESSRIVAPTRVRGAYATLGARWRLPLGFALEPFAQGKRTDYRDFANDFEEGKGGVRLEWSRSEAFAVSAAFSELRRNYRDRAQYSASGRARPGTRLHFAQRDAEFRVRTRWQLAGRWTATAIVGRGENRDEASGYFDFDQKRARLELGWQRSAWRASLSGDAKRTDYLGQTVGAGIAPPLRISDNYELRLRVEREFRPLWVAFAEHFWERSRSNEAGFSYRANTVLTGVQRSF